VSVKAEAREKLNQLLPDIIQLSHRIHENPELGFEEVKAAAWTIEMLAEAGFEVNADFCDLPTAFAATAGSGPLHVCFCAEYDALPEIGHACGHNIITAAAVGAGIAAASVAERAGLTVTVMGTPAEENGDAGGKVLILDRGGFAGIHAAMMVHPAPSDILMPGIIAASMFDVEYIGREAHAAASPEMGINAADAITIAQTAIGLLRQHILPSDRIHGIVTNGGSAANVVPAFVSARYIVRSRTLAELELLRPRVHRCFEAGALATGAALRVIGGERPYSDMIHDPDIAELFRRNAEAIGRCFPDVHPESQRGVVSTDMGNVSHAVPSIHPMISIDSFPAVNHQREFARLCVSAAADKATYEGALAMAWTAIDMAGDDRLRKRLIAKQS
jgi:amidohydrolase